MARNHRHFDASIEATWAVLADGYRYSDWVVGSRKVRDVEAGWPAPGSKIHHSVGIGALAFDDDTRVIEVEPPHRLLLEARLRPFATARVQLEIERRDGGTRAVIDEQIVDGPLARLPARISEFLMWARNVESLRRLKALAERRHRRFAPAGAGSRRGRDASAKTPA